MNKMIQSKLRIIYNSSLFIVFKMTTQMFFLKFVSFLLQAQSQLSLTCTFQIVYDGRTKCSINPQRTFASFIDSNLNSNDLQLINLNSQMKATFLILFLVCLSFTQKPQDLMSIHQEELPKDQNQPQVEHQRHPINIQTQEDQASYPNKQKMPQRSQNEDRPTPPQKEQKVHEEKTGNRDKNIRREMPERSQERRERKDRRDPKNKGQDSSDQESQDFRSPEKERKRQNKPHRNIEGDKEHRHQEREGRAERGNHQRNDDGQKRTKTSDQHQIKQGHRPRNKGERKQNQQMGERKAGHIKEMSEQQREQLRQRYEKRRQQHIKRREAMEKETQQIKQQVQEELKKREEDFRTKREEMNKKRQQIQKEREETTGPKVQLIDLELSPQLKLAVLQP